MMDSIGAGVPKPTRVLCCGPHHNIRLAIALLHNMDRGGSGKGSGADIFSQGEFVSTRTVLPLGDTDCMLGCARL